jgi:hypothetical protein
MLNTQQFTIGTASQKVIGPFLNPVTVTLHNANKTSNTYIWFGGSSAVTTSTGAHLDNADTYQLTLLPGNEIWAISNSSGRELHVLWQNL